MLPLSCMRPQLCASVSQSHIVMGFSSCCIVLCESACVPSERWCILFGGTVLSVVLCLFMIPSAR
jgi:hypothetical protein